MNVACPAYVSDGNGPPLALLHGIGGGAASWARQRAALAADFRVVAWDMPGYGASTPLAQDRPQAADYAAALAVLLDRLRIERCFLLGHSLGALIAAAFARHYPGRVERLMLVSAAAGYGVGVGDPLPKSVLERLQERERLGAEGFAERRVERLCGPGASLSVLAGLRQLMAAIPQAAYAQACALLAQGDLLADLTALSAPIPIQVVCGTLDRITPPERCRAIAAALALPGRRSFYREVLDAGHAVYAEQPEAFHDIVRAFFGGVV